jgi:O-antigen/teichoic acid export membrane protein
MIERVVSVLALMRPAVLRRDRLVVREGQVAVAPLPASVNSLALIVAKVASMGLGFLFWLVAAHLAAPAVVGLAAGAVSAMMLCTQVAILGFGSAVITHLRHNHERLPVLFNSALTLVGGASVGMSLAFILLAGALFRQLDVVARSPWFSVLFVLAGVFGTLGILLDQTATALLRGDQALVRNVAFGAVTLLGLVAVVLLAPRVSAPLVFAPWAVAGALATSASWPRRSISCLTLRTKSPPEISSSPRSRSRPSPFAHP